MIAVDALDLIGDEGHVAIALVSVDVDGVAHTRRTRAPRDAAWTAALRRFDAGALGPLVADGVVFAVVLGVCVLVLCAAWRLWRISAVVPPGNRADPRIVT